MVRGFIILFVFFLSCVRVTGQDLQGRIVKKYGMTEGLSHAVVNCVAQDKKGLMWFATDDGMNRFDGYDFTAFKFDSHSTLPFHDNFVQSVISDDDGNLWVSSRRGLNKFDLSHDRFIPYINKISRSNDVSFISQTRNGNLWLAFYGGGFGFFDKKQEQITTYNLENLPSLSSSSTIVSFEDSYGFLWNGSQDKGLNVYRIRKGKLEKTDSDLSGINKLPSLYVKCIVEDHLGNIWIGTTKGLAVYVRSRGEFQVIPLGSDGPTNHGIFSLLEDSNKTLWIGTLGEGLYTIDLKVFNENHIDELPIRHVRVLDRHSISQTTIRSIYEDRDKNIWLGTHGDGVYMIGSETKAFALIQPTEITEGAEKVVSFNGLCVDKDGAIWAGTNGSGIYKLKRDGTVLRHYVASGKSGAIKDNTVLSVMRDSEDNLWFGTYSAGVFLYDARTDSFIQYTHELSDAAAPLTSQCKFIFEDSRKNVWISTARAGVCLLDKKNRTFRDYKANRDFRHIDARTFAEDKEGDLWIGCYGGGLAHFDPQTNKISWHFNTTESNNPLKSSVVYALAFDAKNRLWIGSTGGLGVFNPQDNTLKRYSEENGLLNNTVYGIQIDETGKLWVCTIKGISKFNPETEQFVNYTYADGLQEGQFNLGSSLFNRSEGYMCFGGVLGMNLFYPGEIKDERRTPKVMISGLQLFNRKIEVGNNEDELLQKVVDETEKVTFTHDQSVFTVDFTALDYDYAQKNKYAYKLENLDANWNYVGNLRSATYRYLEPGEYLFKVKATQDSEWPKEFASIRIEVLPPFWKTPIAYLLYFAFLSLIVWAILRIRTRQRLLSRRLRVEKALRVRQRHMVQEKLSFFTEVSHEFRTPLTLIMGPLEEILTREGNYTPTGKKLKMVYKNAHKLLNLINKLLDYRKADTGNMVLKVKEDNIVTFCEEIFLNFKELAHRKNIDFEFNPGEAEILTWFDKEKLEMVLNNILSNSFKYIGHGDKITVSVTTESGEDDNVVIEVRDNGIGIPHEKLKYIFDWYYQGDITSPVSSGIGLALSKKLVHLHKGLIYVTSQDGEGSVFTVKIPIGKEHFRADEIVVDEQHEGLLNVEEKTRVPEEEHDLNGSRKKGLKNILIVEDDEEIRGFLKSYFDGKYRVSESMNGREALDVAAHSNPDLIISDVMMPEMNGIDFCKQIKGTIKTSHIPVVLLTAKTSFTHHKEGLEIGADAYITKPFSPDMLGLTVENLLQSQENLMRFYRTRFIHNGAEEKGKEINSLDEKLLQRTYDFVKANLDNADVNLEDVCEQLNISRSLLYKKIKSLTGLSPVEYIRSLRLGEAATLLKSGRYKVYEVVYMVGFTDIKYFRQCFQKEFGYPPSSLLDKSGD